MVDFLKGSHDVEEKIHHEKVAYVQRLWLVRHGSTIWNLERRLCGTQDVPLAPLGIQQAHAVGKRLQREQIKTIYCSDLQRARQTAEIIADYCQPRREIQSSALWREMSFGAWEGLTYEQIAQEYGENGQVRFFSDPVNYTPPDGEPLNQLALRITTAFKTLVQDLVTGFDEQQYPEKGDVVLVSHGGALRILLCSLFGIPFKRQWQLRLDNASLSAIDFVPDASDIAATATLALLNLHDFLQID